MGFSRQEYWSQLPFPPPEDVANPWIEPTSPTLAGGFFITEPPGENILDIVMTASSLWQLSIFCTILWNVLCFPQFFNIWMNLRLPSCQFQMCNIAYLISFYFKCEPTLWTLYFSVNLRKQKYLSPYAFRGEFMYVCCTQISLWWSVDYDKNNRELKSLSKFFLQWTRKYSTQ